VNYLVPGATGVVGRHLLASLQTAAHDVYSPKTPM
jgi:uncharacterized protein YbjT (DUF2867 family)